MQTVAILIPCYNEELTIASVITDAKKHLPSSIIYVCDNCSTDNTASIARSLGANVSTERKKGKGNAVRKMFADIDADIFLMIDGDSTYDLSDAPKMISLLADKNVDMVVGVRKENCENAYPKMHKIGNKAFNYILYVLFNSDFTDIFSGYRAFSKRFIKSLPISSTSFDIEAELSIHALTLSIPCAEIESNYFERPLNSHSKLSTFKDGFKILFSIIRLLKETRPFMFFSCISLVLFVVSVVLAYPLLVTFLDIGLVPRLPTAVLSASIMILSFLSLTCGTILDSVSRARQEIKKLHYLLIK